MKPHPVIGQQKGQLSVFLGISLLLVTTLLAFIVNVGLFVRAKINLQNAVDAAAFAGAAVQARQLSNIGYLNWELRNTYKEWMFKYYVLGQLGLRDLRSEPGSGLAHFRMRPFYSEPGEEGIEPNQFDPYNFPSICIHFGSESNVCEIFQIPGLPRFDTVDTGIIGIAEHHRTFLDSIVATKANDCSVRSDLNYGTAVNWAYGTKRAISQNVPIVASDRPGAWIESIELAIRMRNLESLVNRPPIPQPICRGGSGCLEVSSLDAESANIPMNERPIKAFWSAYRNLGGGPNKESLSIAKNFKLTEIPPTPKIVNANSLSGFLIPPSATLAQSGVNALTKHYLDLRAYPVNFVTFFTTFVSVTGEASVAPVVAEAACGGTKTALPVPGYILGFVKNPEVLTYYAVKGETDFVGLFFPFTETNGIKLTAYAAAKPFGGRVGPRLFNDGEGFDLTPRTETAQSRSAPYLSGINVSGIGTFRPGIPIPYIESFWATTQSDVIGGIPTSTTPRYTIPNLMYDFQDQSQLQDQIGTSVGVMEVVERASNKVQSMNNATAENLGLYDYDQYRPFLNILMLDPNIASAINNTIGALNSEIIRSAIYRSRRPTRYEALNYLIPHLNLGDADLELPPSVTNASLLEETVTGHPIYQYHLFAPLFGPGTIYGDSNAFIIQTVENYLLGLNDSINTYLDTLRDISTEMAAEYPTAADTLYRQGDIDNMGSACAGGKQPSMGGKFHIFFRSTGDGVCEIPSLVGSVGSYFTNEASSDPLYKTYYRTTYAPNPDLSTDLMLTGFQPGPRSGSGPDASLQNPIFPADAPRAKRNIYSTKFIPMEKLFSTDCSGGVGAYCSNYSENSDSGAFPSDVTPAVPSNKPDNAVRAELLGSNPGPLRF